MKNNISQRKKTFRKGALHSGKPAEGSYLRAAMGVAPRALLPAPCPLPGAPITLLRTPRPLLRAQRAGRWEGQWGAATLRAQGWAHAHTHTHTHNHVELARPPGQE